MQVRCPSCRNSIEVEGDSPLTDVVCDSCGSQFNLIDTQSTEPYAPGGILAQFALREKLGIGRFGEVWKAEDTTLDRMVAVKIPRKGQLSPEETEQFFREARATAQLQHPGIVTVHEVGRERDTIYIVSDLIDGLTLTDWLTGQQPTARRRRQKFWSRR